MKKQYNKSDQKFDASCHYFTVSDTQHSHILPSTKKHWRSIPSAAFDKCVKLVNIDHWMWTHVLSTGLSIKCIKCAVRFRHKTPHTHHQNKHTRFSSCDQTACRALGSNEAGRRDTWPAVNKERPLWPSHPAHRQQYNLVFNDTQSYKNTQHNIYTFYFPSDNIRVLRCICIPAKTHRHTSSCHLY